MRVAIIGGGGRVGVCAAFALQLGGIVSEIILNDVMTELVQGEALDLLHGTAILHDQRIYAGDMEAVAQADLIIITAGLRRRPDESRLDLIKRNVHLFLNILSDLKSAGLRKESILIVVSNPVDILTQLAVQGCGLPSERIIGLGTLLDTCRFCSLIADTIEVAPTQVKALILGEHGDSMVPIWSTATCNGLSLEKHPRLPAAERNRIFERARQSGAEMLRLKGGAGWAVGASIATLVHAIVLDQRKALPVSSLQHGAYAIRNICISVPTLVGAKGVIGHLEVDLWPRELQGLRSSARLLQEALNRIDV